MMQNVIIGTAGHVDHGKTCLIKALTGTDTDRLKEEKKRGITIELGFASLPNDAGLRIGIIDVPGHEKFIKNMLAGIGGIDLVLLIIGLDEGVMPQTREHFDILKMLQIKKGILVFTKKDLVDEDWADMVEEDTREMVKGSFLEDAPAIRVSSYTGENIEELKTLILDMLKGGVMRRTAPELFRLPVDRVFTMEGFGTVVTGTLTEGSCQVGEDVMIYPREELVHIRGIENHNEKEDAAEAGQRTAINLAGIRKEELERGEILAAPGSMLPGQMADVRIRLFEDTERKLKNNDRVHISFGSAQAVCKAVLLDQDVITKGQQAYAQFRFDDPVAVKYGDRFIIRFYSPVETFGGGVFLEPAAAKHKRGKEEILRGLKIRETGTPEERTEEEVRDKSSSFPGTKELAVRLNLTQEETAEILEKLKKKKTVLSAGDGAWIHKDYWKRISDFTQGILKEFHEKNPIASGMEKEELRTREGQEFHIGERELDILFHELEKRKVIMFNGSAVALIGFESGYSAELQMTKEAILKTYTEAGISCPSNDEVSGKFRDKKMARMIMADLAKNGVLEKVDSSAYMLKEHWEKALAFVRNRIAEKGSFTLAEFRDEFGTSRKYAQLILEAMDNRKLTRLEGDVRVGEYKLNK